MEINKKVALCVGSAIFMSWIGKIAFGVKGMVYGFVFTLLLIGIFSVWLRMRKED